MSRHKKRRGAIDAMASFQETSFSVMANTTVRGDAPEYTHGAAADLKTHIANLRREFVGQSELNYWIASTIVLIRREVDVEKNVAALFDAFTECGTQLIQSLNTRWLVSCADTYADYHSDPLERSYGLAIGALVNSVKLTETERVVRGINEPLPDVSDLDMGRKRIALWDGTSAFAIGTDDTLRNFCWRMERVKSQLNEVPVMLSTFEEIFRRLSNHDTVYGRFKAAHHRERTQWW